MASALVSWFCCFIAVARLTTVTNRLDLNVDIHLCDMPKIYASLEYLVSRLWNFTFCPILFFFYF